MDFGLQKEEIELLVEKTIEEQAKRHNIGPQLEGNQIRQVRNAIAEVIFQNNARIFEALTNAGIRL